MIHVYTGNGKGKTTAAVGLAVRAAGAGLRIYVVQFLKCGEYGEVRSLKKIKNIRLEQFGCGPFIKQRHCATARDRKEAARGLEAARRAVLRKAFDVVVLDEINPALKLGLLKLQDIISLIKMTPDRIDLVLTGRYAHADIVKLADLVSEVKQVKHYFNRGVKARRGIEY